MTKPQTLFPGKPGYVGPRPDGLVLYIHHDRRPAADIRSARLALGLTQAQLGEAVGVLGRQVRHWESGSGPVPLAVALLLGIWTHTQCPEWVKPPRGERSRDHRAARPKV